MLRRISLIVLGILAAGVLAVGWYAYNKGFTDKWKRFVALEFHKRGVELSLTRLTLEPFRGILAKQVRIYDNRDRKRMIAVVDEVRLVINYANLFQGQPFIDALELRDANLDVPLDPSKRNRTQLEIRHLSGLLFLPPQQIYLSRLDADVYGIHLRASGRVINPQRLFPLKNIDVASAESRLKAIENALAELKTLRYEGTAPQIDLRFSGDLAAPKEIFVEGTLWAGKVRRGNYRVENLYVNGGFRDGILRLRQIAGNDSGGTLHASGDYDIETHEASLQLRSDLDVQALVRSFTRVAELDETVFYTLPAVDLTARASFGNQTTFQVLGHVEVKKFAYKSVIFDGLNADLSCDGTRWSALDVDLVHRTGRITGDLLHSGGEDRSSLKSTIQRKVLNPLFSGKGAEWISRIEFVESADATTGEYRVAADAKH